MFDKYDISIFGSSSSGEIEQDEIFEKSIVVMLIDIRTEDFNIYIQETGDDTIKNISEQAVAHAFKLFENPAIIVVASGLDTDGEEIVETIKNFSEKIIPIFGGLAGDDLQMVDTFVFSNNKVVNKGLICFIINTDKIKVSGTATSGWETIGVETTVTNQKGILYILLKMNRH